MAKGVRQGTFFLDKEQPFDGAVNVSQGEGQGVEVTVMLPPHWEPLSGSSQPGDSSPGSHTIREAIQNVFDSGMIQGAEDAFKALKLVVMEQTLRFTGHPEAARRYRERMG